MPHASTWGSLAALVRVDPPASRRNLFCTPFSLRPVRHGLTGSGARAHSDQLVGHSRPHPARRVRASGHLGDLSPSFPAMYAEVSGPAHGRGCERIRSSNLRAPSAVRYDRWEAPPRRSIGRDHRSGLSIILSINSGQLAGTAAHPADEPADQSGVGGIQITPGTVSGPLAVSPIRPLSHLSNGHNDTAWTPRAAWSA